MAATSVETPLNLDDFDQLASLNVETLHKFFTSKDTKLSTKTRILWQLRDCEDLKSIEALIQGLDSDSNLLRHEICYALGQKSDDHAIGTLKKLLEDSSEHSMVRHEAGEALGAIATPDCLEIVRKHATDPCREVAETCQLALDRIDYVTKTNAERKKKNILEDEYTSVDPAPAHESTSIPELRRIYLDTSLHLFERYKAMFALRNIGSAECVKVLCEGFKDPSSLFKHEVAFVLGQIQRDAGAVSALTEVLRDLSEHPMVRHEAAEALGSIAAEKALPLLREFTDDVDPVVKDSCVVALDVHDYWSKFGGKRETDEQ